jgi:WD40 repeat protein
LEGLLVKRLIGAMDRINALSPLPNGHLVSFSDDKVIKIWDIDTGVSLQSFKAYRSTAINSIKNELLIGGDSEEYLMIKSLYGNIETPTPSTLPYLITNSDKPSDLVATKTGDLIAMGTSITVWDVDLGKHKTTFKSDFSFYSDIKKAVVLNSGDLATNGYENNVLIWDTEHGSIKRMLTGHHQSGTVRNLALLNNGDLVSGTSLEIIIWNVTTWTVKRVINESSHTLCTLKSGLLANAFYSTQLNSTVLNIWNPEGGELIKSISKNVSLNYFNMIGLANGDLLISAYITSQNISQTDIEIWDPSAGLYKRTLLSSNFSHNNLFALMPNNQLAIAIHTNRHDSGTIQIWDTDASIQKKTLIGHNAAITSLAVLKDGRLASAGQDRMIRIWSDV